MQRAKVTRVTAEEMRKDLVSVLRPKTPAMKGIVITGVKIDTARRTKIAVFCTAKATKMLPHPIKNVIERIASSSLNFTFSLSKQGFSALRVTSRPPALSIESRVDITIARSPAALRPFRTGEK